MRASPAAFPHTTTPRPSLPALRLLGKEAGLFVPSGTMSNLIGVCIHCEVRGSEYIIGSEAHIYIFEQGGAATLGGAHPRVVVNQVGALTLNPKP